MQFRGFENYVLNKKYLAIKFLVFFGQKIRKTLENGKFRARIIRENFQFLFKNDRFETKLLNFSEKITTVFLNLKIHNSYKNSPFSAKNFHS